jgi:hypothetical protein
MATTNLTVTAAGVKLADANADFFVSLPWKTATTIEWATTDTPGVKPTAALWHPLRGHDGDRLNRAISETDLEIWARSPGGDVSVVLN